MPSANQARGNDADDGGETDPNYGRNYLRSNVEIQVDLRGNRQPSATHPRGVDSSSKYRQAWNRRVSIGQLVLLPFDQHHDLRRLAAFVGDIRETQHDLSNLFVQSNLRNPRYSKLEILRNRPVVTSFPVFFARRTKRPPFTRNRRKTRQQQRAAFSKPIDDLTTTALKATRMRQIVRVR